jgi:hypothetical protein
MFSHFFISLLFHLQDAQAFPADLVFGALGDEHLYATMMLLVGNEYVSGVFPMLMLYHR